MLLIWLGTPWLAFQVHKWTRYMSTFAHWIGVPQSRQAANAYAVLAEIVHLQRVLLLLLRAT
jgi:hypothetical protein